MPRRATSLPAALRTAATCAALSLPACGGSTIHQPIAVQSSTDGPTTSGAAAAASKRVICDRLVEDFSATPIGEFPVGWRTRAAGEMPFATAKKIYTVEREQGRSVLHGVFTEKPITIGRLVQDWDLEEYPIVEWQWKAIRLPEGGDETRSEVNDAGAAVYAIWDVGFPMMIRGIKYSWSTTLPVGTHASKRLGYDQLLVMESGEANLGQWQTVRVDVLENSKQFFGWDEANAPDGLALYTDAGDTQSTAEAFWADFKLCRIEESAAEPAPK